MAAIHAEHQFGPILLIGRQQLGNFLAGRDVTAADLGVNRIGFD
jgi:hypothetical protein